LRVRDRLATSKRSRVGDKTKDSLFEALIERFPFPVPESLVQQQVNDRLERGLRALASQGMDPEQLRGLDVNRLRAAQRPSALAEVKTWILLDRIADEEKITVSDEEFDGEMKLAAVQLKESVEAMRKRLTKEGAVATIRRQLRRQKIGQLLYDRLPA
jgi:trigger factor